MAWSVRDLPHGKNNAASALPGKDTVDITMRDVVCSYVYEIMYTVVAYNTYRKPQSAKGANSYV
ncbi:MAG: hypothetical protein LBI44_04820, partial [Oscillospiraceae bacterium]|nr:hypothetical protein [Oscillospiraceae bacterium]